MKRISTNPNFTIRSPVGEKTKKHLHYLTLSYDFVLTEGSDEQMAYTKSPERNIPDEMIYFAPLPYEFTAGDVEALKI